MLVLFADLSRAQITDGATQGLNKNKIIASYLYNFAKNIEWPADPALVSFDIGVYGKDNPQLLSELSLLADKAKIKNKPITASVFNSIKALTKYQLVYVDQANNKMIADIYDALEGKPVLLVTSEYSNKQLVMINLSAMNDHMHFEVNNSNILNHGLKPLPELILNGGTEIDVAKLYREGQASLLDMQKQLQAREKMLTELTATILNQQVVNARLESKLTMLDQNIQKSDAIVVNQKAQINTQLEQIEKNRKERGDLLHEMELRTTELATQQQQLMVVQNEIDNREKKLSQLNDTIKAQESELLLQKEAITGLDEKVGSQNISLRYLWNSVFLGAVSIITILAAYFIKRRDNKRLAARSQDLQIARDRLAHAKRKAEDASQAKGDFLALMSHELRTPLQAIIGYTDVVLEELKLQDDAHHVDDLTRVISNAERLLKLINGVLDLAKIEAGKMELDLTEVKLSSLLDEALGTVGPLFEKNAIQVISEVDDGELLPVADPEKLLHILINLLGNASKFSPKGIVTVKALHLPQEILLSVADTGIGISAQQRVYIFDAFSQADSSTTRKFQGSGLGLSITRQLCEMMGGTISVASELGKGSIFTVNIPLPIKHLHSQSLQQELVRH